MVEAASKKDSEPTTKWAFIFHFTHFRILQLKYSNDLNHVNMPPPLFIDFFTKLVPLWNNIEFYEKCIHCNL